MTITTNRNATDNRCMKRVFGELIAELPELSEGELLPSPESLRGKIIIKGKKTKEGEVRLMSSLESLDRH